MLNNYSLIKQSILNSLMENNIHEFTNIQKLTLPHTLKNKNIIGIAPTGSGKSLAFIIPIFNKMEQNDYIQSIILCPTRELARQIYSYFTLFKSINIKYKTVLWIGGDDINKQISNTKNANIIIATPNRFLDITSKVNFNFKNLNTIVIDEVDMLFDLGFATSICSILEKYKNIDNIQMMAFSATSHDFLNQKISLYLNKPLIINTSINVNNNIKHYLVKTNDKIHALSVIINQINPYICLIFTNTKKQADYIYKLLLEQNRSVINLHGGLKTRERKNNFKNINNNKYQYIVCSDLASRGLDIKGVSHVINYNLVDDPIWYIHRAGRTGRGKYEGESYILYSNDEYKIVSELDKKIKFNNCIIKNNRLVFVQKNIYKKPQINFEQEKEIKAYIKLSKKEIKPNYKKKMKKDILKIKKKYKRKYIDDKMNANRLLSYKKTKK